MEHKEANTLDDHTHSESEGRAYTANSEGYHFKFYDHDGHTSGRCHMSSDNRGNHLPRSLRDKLSWKTKDKIGSSKSSAKSSEKSFKIEIAGLSIEMYTALPSIQADMETYAESEAISHSFCSRNVFVPRSLHEVNGTIILPADNTSVTAMQRGDLIVPFSKGNL